VERQSPLGQAFQPGSHGNFEAGAGVTLSETQPSSIVQVAAWPGAEKQMIAAIRSVTGLTLPDGAGGGVADGAKAAFGFAPGKFLAIDEAEDLADKGRAVILARPTTDPDDVAAMSASVAVVTELGGSTSHAAVVCREMAVPCVVGCGMDSVTALAGRVVTVDADTGTVHLGELPVRPLLEADDEDLRTIERWLRDDLENYDPSYDVVALIERRQQRGATR